MIFASNDITNRSIEFPDNRSTQYDDLIFATFFNCMHLVFQTNGQIKFSKCDPRNGNRGNRALVVIFAKVLFHVTFLLLRTSIFVALPDFALFFYHSK